MNSDKAYLFGLLTGGGHLGHDALSVVMPFKQWGDVSANPKRAGNIASDILRRVQPIFRNEYGMDVAYTTEPTWRIKSNRLSDSFKSDLQLVGFPKEGDIRSSVDISLITGAMSTYAKKMFIAGIADTVGSLAKSHRRFTNNYQVISFEFKDRNFKLVSQLVKLLSELGCHPDQVLWNHPNQHAGRDRYYKNWKKGFKIRVALDDYMVNGSFIFTSKDDSAKENKEIQTSVRGSGLNAIKQISVGHHNTVHIDEDSHFLPQQLRGYHFIHNQHISAAMGCNTTPLIDIEEQLKNFNEKFTPFTKLTKGTTVDIERIINGDDFLNELTFEAISRVSFRELLNLYTTDTNSLILRTATSGYPVGELIEAIVYAYCANRGVHINGSRIAGKLTDVIDIISRTDYAGLTNYSVRGNRTLISPLVINNGSNSAIVGPYSPELNQKLIIKDGPLKYRIRKPLIKDLHV